MADVKVSALTALTGADLANGDQFLVTDVGSPNVSKSITMDELAQGSQFSSRYASSTSFPSGGWDAWTPTVTSQTGTITTVTGSGRYKQYGKLVHALIEVTVTTKGTAGGSLEFTLPVTAASRGVNFAGWCGGYTCVTNSLAVGGIFMRDTAGGFLMELDTSTPFNADGDVLRGYFSYEAA
jgi:hypothetical protein